MNHCRKVAEYVDRDPVLEYGLFDGFFLFQIRSEYRPERSGECRYGDRFIEISGCLAFVDRECCARDFVFECRHFTSFVCCVIRYFMSLC